MLINIIFILYNENRSLDAIHRHPPILGPKILSLFRKWLRVRRLYIWRSICKEVILKGSFFYQRGSFFEMKFFGKTDKYYFKGIFFLHYWIEACVKTQNCNELQVRATKLLFSLDNINIIFINNLIYFAGYQNSRKQWNGPR